MSEVREVFSVDDGRGDYEWSELHVYVHPAVDGKFAIDTDSGCSCDGYYAPTVDELRAETPLTISEVRADIAKWLDSEGYSPDGRARELERATLALRGPRPDGGEGGNVDGGPA